MHAAASCPTPCDPRPPPLHRDAGLAQAPSSAGRPNAARFCIASGHAIEPLHCMRRQHHTCWFWFWCLPPALRLRPGRRQTSPPPPRPSHCLLSKNTHTHTQQTQACVIRTVMRRAACSCSCVHVQRQHQYPHAAAGIGAGAGPATRCFDSTHRAGQGAAYAAIQAPK